MQWQRVSVAGGPSQPGFALNLPGDWNYEEADSGIIIFNQPNLFERDEPAEMPAGAIVASLTLLSEAEARRTGARDAAGILKAFLGSAGELPAPDYGSVEGIEMSGRDMAQASLSAGNLESLLLSFALQRHYALAILVAPAGELQRQGDLLRLIFDSLELRAGQ